MKFLLFLWDWVVPAGAGLVCVFYVQAMRENARLRSEYRNLMDEYKMLAERHREIFCDLVEIRGRCRRIMVWLFLVAAAVWFYVARRAGWFK